MSAAAFDTHQVVKELIAAGFTDEQAEAVTRVVRSAQSAGLSDLATGAELRVGLAATKIELQVSLAEAKAEILKWMFGAVGLQTVVILGAVIALARMGLH